MVSTIIAYAANALVAAGVSAATATFVATFAVNFAISTIVTRVFGQDQQGPQDSGTRQQVPPSSVNAIPIVYGNAYLGGTFVDAVLTTDQKTMYYVVAVSCISPSGQFSFDTDLFYYGDRLVVFDSTDTTKVIKLIDEAENEDTKISGNLYINLYKSNAAGVITPLNGASAPNVVMGGSDIDVDLRWPSSGRQMNGLAFAIIKLNYNQDAGTTNLSPITFAAQHYLNSTGVAKPGDVWYDYITNVQYGGAVDASFVDASSATALNAYADETITYTPSGGGSATQARYRMNGVLDAGQTVLSNLDKIMTCSDSWMAYNAAKGQWSIVINKEDSVSYAFDDDNIIGEVRVSATDITQSINQVEAKFPDKGARDQPNFVNIATPDILRYPNEPDNKYSVTYDLCNDSVQAQYLANRILEQAREDLIVSFSTTYYGIQVDAGTVVSVTNSDYGWNNKLFRVVKVNEASLPDGSLGAKLEMSEYSAAVYDDFDITQYVPVPNSGLPSAVYFSPLSAPVVTASNPTSAIPNFNVSVAIPAVGRVTRGELFYTTVAIPSASDWRLLSSASTVDGVPVTPSTTYVFANQVLPTGASPTETYYFSYVVGNENATSTKSPISASFTWTPVAGTGPTGATGPTGEPGDSGDSVDIIFKRSATQPTTPSPSVGTPATWYSDVNSVPAGSDPIWSSVGTNTGIGTNYVWQTPLLIEGQDGSNGLSVAELLIYIRATSAPATPTGGSYNFTTQTLTAPASWSSAIPAGTNPVYTSRAVASVQGTTGTDSTLTWSSPVLSIQNGTDGATGPTGPSGVVGDTGPRTAQIYYYYNTPQASAPTAPTTAQVAYNFSTSTPTITTAGWSSTFNPSAVGTTTASNKYWAVRVIFQENTFGGTYTETISSVFTWQNMDGLVTFTNLSAGLGPLGTNTTYIDGGTITTDTLNVNKIKNNTSGTFNSNVTFGLGTGTAVGGYLAGGAFISTSLTYYGLLATNTVGGDAFGAGTTSTTADNSAIVGVGYGNSTFTTFRSLGAMGSGTEGGSFQHGGTNSLTVSTAADIRLARYTGGVAYAYYIISGAAFPFTAGHDGLQLLTQTEPDVGDIMVDVQLIAADDINNTITQMSVSASANQVGAIGVYVGNSGPDFVPAALGEYTANAQGVQTNFVLKPEFANIYETYRPIAVNAIGEGKINVCNQGGDIAIGDLLVCSDVPGKGMKQADDVFHSYTVAKARENVIFAGPSDIRQIACIYMGG
jgi:hypothetical protein